MKLIIICLLISTLIFISCKNNSVATENNEPGSRNYIWTIDTISSGSLQTNLITLWGSSSKNVWMAGYNSDNTKCVYHYDGNRFNPVIIPTNNFITQFYDINGIDSNNIFFIGQANYYNPSPPPNFLDSGFVFQYLNGNWKLHIIPNLNPLYSVCFDNTNGIWVGGGRGYLYRYDGSNWSSYFLGDEKLFINCLVSNDLNEVYASGHVEKIISGSEYYLADYLFRYGSTGWTLIDSNITSKNYNRFSYPVLMKNIDGTIYGSGENGFVKKNGDSWIILNAEIYGQFDGTGQSNIFLVNRVFGVNHFNGSDWYHFKELPNLNYYDLEVFKDVVFLLANENNKSIVIKGILK